MGIKVGDLLKNISLQMKHTYEYKRTLRKSEVSMPIEVFVNQKRVNVCEYSVKMVPHDSFE